MAPKSKSEPLSPEMKKGLGALKELLQIGPGVVQKPAIPVRWILTDIDGRSLDATIIGKSGSQITLVRRADGKRFDLPISRLSEGDRDRVKALDGKTAPSEHPMESSFYRMKQTKLDELEAGLAELNREYEATKSDIKLRSLLREMELLKFDRAKLLKELSDLERF